MSLADGLVEISSLVEYLEDDGIGVIAIDDAEVRSDGRLVSASFTLQVPIEELDEDDENLSAERSAEEDEDAEPESEDSPSFDVDDPDHLKEAYEAHDSIADAAEEFDATYGTVRNRLIDHGIHDPDSYDYGGSDDEDTGGAGDDPAEFGDVHTPDWLDESSFHQGIEMSSDVEGLAEVLGWDDMAAIKRVVEELGVQDDLVEEVDA